MDRETVITRLQVIHTWAEFAREYDLQFFTAKHLEDIAQWADDALELLKAQQLDIESLKKAYNDLAEKGEPVVRCRDCKHGEPGECGYGIDCYGEFWHEPDWFCADGERRETNAAD